MPPRCPGDVARVEQRQAAEQGPHRLPRPQVQPRRSVLVDRGGLVGRRVVVRGQVRDHQEAPRRHGVHQGRGEAGRIVGVRHEMQDRDEQHGDRLVPAEQGTDPRVPGDPVGVSQVVVDDGGAVHAVQHVPRVGHHHRVVVDVHHAAVRRGPSRATGPGDLVHAAHGGQSGADVEELPDPQVADQVADRTPEEEPVLEHRAAHDILAQHVESPARRLTVSREVVLAAEHEVVHPRDVRHLRAERRLPPHHGPSVPSRGYAVIGTSTVVTRPPTEAASRLRGRNRRPRQACPRRDRSFCGI